MRLLYEVIKTIQVIRTSFRLWADNQLKDACSFLTESIAGMLDLENMLTLYIKIDKTLIFTILNVMKCRLL